MRTPGAAGTETRSDMACRALKRYLRDCDSVVLSRMFVNEEETDDDVVEIIPLADFIGIRMVIHRLTSIEE